MSRLRPSRWIGPTALLVVAVLLVRLPVLLAQLDTWYAFEVFSGSVAAALLDGLDLDVRHLYIIQHIRGGAFFGLLLVPLYALLGATALALKLLPLLWHAATVALASALAGRAFGRSAALTTGGLLLLAQPVLAKLSVVGFASHMESSLPALAAYGLYLALGSDGRSLRRWLALGLVTGFAAFFHLQALLPCLILLAMAALRRPREALRGAPLLVAGAALGFLPTLLFESDDRTIVDFVLESGRDADRVVASEGGGGISHYGRWGKASALLTSGLGPVLEFGPAEDGLAPVVAHLYGLALLAGCALAVWRERAGLLAWLGRLLGRSAPVSPAAFLLTHAVAVLVLFVLSGMALNFWADGSGMEGRRLTPALTSLLLLAGIGLARDGAGRRSPLAWLALGVLLAGGAWGTLTHGRWTPAGGPLQRGECYEWFQRQLEHHAGGDDSRLLDELQRIDRGDVRFQTLRFSPSLGISPGLPFEANLQRALQPEADVRLRLFRLTALGRAACAPTRPELPGLPLRAPLAALPPAERATVFHGAGLNLAVLLPRTTGLHPLLERLAREFPARDAEPLFEGFGFAQGFVHNAYNEFHCERLVQLGGLPEAVRGAFFRGFGWGYRQRWVTPPSEVPGDLPVLDLVPDEARVELLAGLLGRRLPVEADLLLASGRG